MAIISWGRQHFYPHFIDEGTEAGEGSDLPEGLLPGSWPLTLCFPRQRGCTPPPRPRGSATPGDALACFSEGQIPMHPSKLSKMSLSLESLPSPLAGTGALRGLHQDLATLERTVGSARQGPWLRASLCARQHGGRCSVSAC